jgi:hypothetical protein
MEQNQNGNARTEQWKKEWEQGREIEDRYTLDSDKLGAALDQLLSDLDDQLIQAYFHREGDLPDKDKVLQENVKRLHPHGAILEEKIRLVLPAFYPRKDDGRPFTVTAPGGEEIAVLEEPELDPSSSLRPVIDPNTSTPCSVTSQSASFMR